MPAPNSNRRRFSRASQLEMPPGRFATAVEFIRRSDVLLRLITCLLAALAMWVGTCGWLPPIIYRMNGIPPRNIIPRVTFERKDLESTKEEQRKARETIECIYDHDVQKLTQLRALLTDRMMHVMNSPSFDQLDRDILQEFYPEKEESGTTTRADASKKLLGGPVAGDSPPAHSPPAHSPTSRPRKKVIDAAVSNEAPLDKVLDAEIAQGTPETTVPSGIAEHPAQSGAAPPEAPLSREAQRFQSLRAALTQEAEHSELARSLERAFSDTERYGLFDRIEHEPGKGLTTAICVRRPDGEELPRVAVDQVRKGEAFLALEKRIDAEFSSKAVSEAVTYWIKSRLPSTLSYNLEASQEVARQAAAAVEESPVMTTYAAGDNDAVLALGGKPLTIRELDLLQSEREAYIEQMGWRQRAARTLSGLGMYTALYVLCGVYIFYRRRSLLRNWRRFLMLQLLIVATVLTSYYMAHDPWQAELIPLMLFAMILGIAHQQELALLLSVVVTLVVSMSLGLNLVQFVILAASLASTIMLLRDVRTRSKLIYVGFVVGVIAVMTTVGAGTTAGWVMELPTFKLAVWYGFCAVLAGVLMTGLLPFVERLFDVQTDISLLELGDIAHPLLQELVRRAPGTYNHSINVASIAEAAAESIGANGLLVRVGAYFHDIGKMLKPGYFVENQGQDENRHDALLPAMSTLIIIAHVKDGADLARQHHLPQPIIDFILQHHGTTLVEYFFRRASEQSESDPDSNDVDEGSYRYPGPKPQTREAAVLMLADAVESASRTLVEPAPSRIEGLVEEIAMKRLLDGQFDDCGLTLQELRMVQESLVKSLTAMYHGRVKYPDQQTA